MRKLSLFVAFLFVPAGALAGSKLDSLSTSQAQDLAKALCKVIDMPSKKRKVVMARVEETLHNPRFRKRIKKEPLSGVFAYQLGEGGFIVKVMKGDGKVTFAGGGKEKKMKLSSTSVGASIGGSSEWGIGFVLGLKEQRDFGGEYSGNTRGATLGGTSANITELHLDDADEDDEEFHRVYMIGSASGASANAGGVSLEITLRR